MSKEELTMSEISMEESNKHILEAIEQVRASLKQIDMVFKNLDHKLKNNEQINQMYRELKDYHYQIKPAIHTTLQETIRTHDRKEGDTAQKNDTFAKYKAASVINNPIAKRLSNEVIFQ